MTGGSFSVESGRGLPDAAVAFVAGGAEGVFEGAPILRIFAAGDCGEGPILLAAPAAGFPVPQSGVSLRRASADFAARRRRVGRWQATGRCRLRFWRDGSGNKRSRFRFGRFGKSCSEEEDGGIGAAETGGVIFETARGAFCDPGITLADCVVVCRPEFVSVFSASVFPTSSVARTATPARATAAGRA